MTVKEPLWFSRSFNAHNLDQLLDFKDSLDHYIMSNHLCMVLHRTFVLCLLKENLVSCNLRLLFKVLAITPISNGVISGIRVSESQNAFTHLLLALGDWQLEHFKAWMDRKPFYQQPTNFNRKHRCASVISTTLSCRLPFHSLTMQSTVSSHLDSGCFA